MHRKALLVSLALALTLMLIVPMPVFAPIPRPTHLVIVTIGEPETADPAWLYDTASAELCQHVYEPLIFFNVTRDMSLAAPYLIDPATAGLTDQFVPAIAESWTITDISETSPEGLNWVQRWNFTIRSGVQFHDGSTVTPQDVEYSFERWMVQCRSGGPTWMILEPTLGRYSTRGLKLPQNATVAESWGKQIDHSVESSATNVWFNLVMKYAPFPTIIAQSWAGIVSYDWCSSMDIQIGTAPRKGDWPGVGVSFAERWTYGATPPDYQEWIYWNNPAVPPIDQAYTEKGTKPLGAGPYKFDYWSKGVEWQISSFANYYRGWPAPVNTGAVSGTRLPAQIDTITEKFINEWATRKMMFLSGDADFVAVPRSNIPELWLNWPGKPETYPSGVTCTYDLPTLTCSPVLFYTYDVATTSPFLGVVGGLPPGTFSEAGIPPNFFNDSDVRKAFSYCVNYTKYLTEVYMAEAEVCVSPMIEGCAYYNPDQTGPWFPDGNLTAAKEAFMAAWGGALWTGGFKIGLSYNTGNTARQKACESLKTAIEGAEIGNTKFHVNVVGIDWPTYLGHLVAGELTGFVLGWLADFPDPHNFAMPFMHTMGDFGGFQLITYGQSGRMQYSILGDPTKPIDNAYVDHLIEEAAAIPDDDVHHTLTGLTNTSNVDKLNPKCSTWNDGTHNYHIRGYIDAPGTGTGLDAGDYIWLTNLSSPIYEKGFYKVTSLTGDPIMDVDCYTRGSVYYELAEIYVDENPSVPLCKPTGRHFERTWMKGWYYNPIHPGITYYYHVYKATPTVWEPVDVSAKSSLTPPTPHYPEVQVYEGEMRVAGSVVYMPYTLTFNRTDSNTAAPSVWVLAGLNRTDLDGNVVVTPDTYLTYLTLVSRNDTYLFNWSAPPDEMTEGMWTISGVVGVSGEEYYDSDLANNIDSDGVVDARELPGDIDGNGEVDIFDAITFSGHFGGGPGNPDLYDPLCDLNGDGEIDIFDAIILAGNFGKVWP